MDWLYQIDFSILNFIQEHLRCPLLDAAMPVVSHLGYAGMIWIVCSVVMLFFKKTRAAGVMALVAMGLGYLLGDLVIKPLVLRPRPFETESGLRLLREAELLVSHPGSHSFPSGHSVAAAGFVTVLFATHKRLAWIALAPVLLMMFSRLYNYVHFPSDVLAGALFGVLVALTVVLVFRKTGLERRLSPQKAEK